MPRAKAPIPRRTRLRQRNPERRARTWAEQFHSVERVVWVKSQPCCTCPNPGGLPVENSHTPSVAVGGTYKDIAPQCIRCHRELHHEGPKTFCRRRGLPLDHLRTCARDTQAAWLESQRRAGR